MYAPSGGLEVRLCTREYIPRIGAVRHRRAVDSCALDEAIRDVVAEWAHAADRGLMSPQTLDKFALLAERFGRYARAHAVTDLRSIDARMAGDFIASPGRSRHGAIADSAVATQHLRRSVLRLLFRTARGLDLADTDPTLDLMLPARTPATTRPLTADEAVLVRRFAESRLQRTRHAATTALADAGAHSGEIGHLTVADLDLAHARVWVPGSGKTDQRWCPLDGWQLSVLTARARRLREAHPHGADSDLPLATSGRGSDAQLQARVCVALGDMLAWAGLAEEPDIRPASITAHAALRVFQDTGRIEAAARLVGLRSLDRAATLLGYNWADEPR
jgi:integrase